MTGIIETMIATFIVNEIDAGGICHHKSMSYMPITIGENEAASLNRFDPEIYNSLGKIGIIIEKLKMEDLDRVGSLIDELIDKLKLNAADDNAFLYKHSIASRLSKCLLMSNQSPSRDRMIVCADIFGHNWNEF